jgi:hypothetical protein
LQFLFESFGAGPDRFEIDAVTGRAEGRDRQTIVAIVTKEAPPPGMKGEGDVTVRAVETAAAIAAKDRRGKAAAVEEKEDLSLCR